MGCQVIRAKDTKEIVRVTDSQGQDSSLFSEVKDIVMDPEHALRVWAQVYTPQFKRWLNWSTEPQIVGDDLEATFNKGTEVKPVFTEQDKIRANAYNQINDKDNENKIVGEAAFKELADKLSNQFGVPYEIITPEVAKEVTKDQKVPWNGENAFAIGDKVYFIQGKLSMDLPLHEYGHYLVHTIAKENPALFNNLYTKLVKEEGGREALHQIEGLYPELANQTDKMGLMQEVMVWALTQEAQAKLNPESVLGSYVKRFLAALRTLLNRVFGRSIKPGELSVNTQLGQLAELLSLDNSRVVVGTDLELSYSRKEDVLKGLEDIQASQQALDLDKRIKEAYVYSSRLRKILGKEMSPDTRQTISQLIKFLEDDQSIGQLRTYALFLQESSNILDDYARDVNSIARDSTLSLTERAAKMHYFYQYSSAYDNLIDSIRKDLTGLPRDNSVREMLDDIRSNVNEIQKVYDNTMLDVLSDILSEENEYSNQEGIKKLQKELEVTNKAIEERTKEGREDRVKLLQEKKARIEKFIEDKVPTKALLQEVMSGNKGDSSFMSMLFEATISNGDAVLSTFAKFVKNKFNDMRERVNTIRNKMYGEMQSFQKATGRKPGNNKEYYQDLYEVQKRINQKGETEQVLALVGQFTDQYINDQQVFFNKIQEARNKNSPEEVKEAQLKLREWRQQYMEQPYTQEYYDAYKLLTPEALEARKYIFDSIRSLEVGEMTPDKLDEINYLWKEYKQLGYLYDAFGDMKTDKDLAVAKSIIAFNEARREMITYELNDKGKALFNRLLGEQQALLDAGKITQDDFDLWMRQNTTREVDPRFYEERNNLIAEINLILSALPKEANVPDLSDLWNRVFAVSNMTRDEDRIPDGNTLSLEQQDTVNGLNQEIEDIRNEIVGSGGLTKYEKLRMSKLFNKSKSVGLTEEEQLELDEYLDRKKQTKKSLGAYISPADQKRLDTLFNQLNNMQKVTNTDYYQEAYNNHYNAYKAEFIKQFGEGVHEMVIKDKFEMEDDWYKKNHYVRIQWEDYGDGDGGYEESYVPSYVWRDIAPADDSYILQAQPSFKYKTRVVKDQYKNKNFTSSSDGYNTPKLEVNGKPSKYINPNYEALKNSKNTQDQGKFKFLKYLSDTYLAAQENLPMAKRMGLIVPSIQKSTFDRLQDGKLPTLSKSTFSNLKTDIANRLWRKTGQDSDEGIVALGDLAGNEFNYVPTRFTGKIDANDVSLDLAESIIKFVLSAERTKVLNDALPVAEGLQNVLAKNKVSIDKIDAVAAKYGLTQFLKMRGSSVRERHLNEFINMIFYNEFEKEEAWGSISLTKISNNLMKVGALQMLAANIPAQITNYVSGYMQSVIESSGKEFYTLQDLATGVKKYKQSYPDLIQDAFKFGQKSLIGQMFDLYDVEQGKFESHIGHKSDFSLLKELPSVPYILKNAGEHELVGKVFLAMANGKVLDKEDGTKIKLIDAYELDKSNNIKLKDGVKFSNKEKNHFNNQVHGLLRKLNGNYDKFNKPYIEKHALGRLAVFMRKYIVPLVMNRWGNERYDNETTSKTKGFYRVFWGTMGKDLVKLRLNVADNWQDYTPQERAAIMRTLSEAGLILLMMTAMMFLGAGFFGDKKDYKENGFIVNHILYQIIKVKGETENFNPIAGTNEIYRTVTTPTIALQSIKNLLKTGALIGSTVLGDDDAFYKKDTGYWEEGDSKLAATLAAMIGFKGSSFTPETLIDNYSKAQKVR